MKASETTLQPLIEGTKQYVVPLFQRAYSWDTPNWRTLWNDIFELYEDDDNRGHFIGSIVTSPTDSVPQGVSKYLLIDGQQRLTTLFILLAAIREEANSTEHGNLSLEINETLLTNRFKDGDEFWKLLPTHTDREAFIAVLGEQESIQGNLVQKAFSFFRREIKRVGDMDLALLKKVIVSDLILGFPR